MFGLFSTKKTYHADVNCAQSTVEIPPGDTLLNAALEAGIPWPHNCRVGSCGTLPLPVNRRKNKTTE